MAGGEGPFTIAVSNTLVGNGWREQMICAVQAEAAAEGDIEQVVVFNENGAAPEQIRHVEQAISQGVDALVINPSSTTELNSILEEAINQGLIVVAVDQALDVEGVYNVTNDQEAYGRLGMEWLAEELGGEGRVMIMNGIDGAPANEARRAGIDAALEAYPDIEITQETFTGWDFSVASQQALDLLNADPEIDGIWTSGTDYTVANAFETANLEPVPVVGADTNEFQAPAAGGRARGRGHQPGHHRRRRHRHRPEGPPRRGGRHRDPPGAGGLGRRDLARPARGHLLRGAGRVRQHHAVGRPVHLLHPGGAPRLRAGGVARAPWGPAIPAGPHGPALRQNQRPAGARRATGNGPARGRNREGAMADRPLLAARGVAKRYGPVVALTKVDLTVDAGEIHALLGSNGAGKSTLVKILSGVVAPDQGTLEVNGRPRRMARPADAARVGWPRSSRTRRSCPT